MTNSQKKSLCAGCRDDYYNRPGNSPIGECFSLAKATVVERTQVGWWQNPPYTWSPVQTLSCHHAPGQIAWIDRDDVRLRENGCNSVEEEMAKSLAVPKEVIEGEASYSSAKADAKQFDDSIQF